MEERARDARPEHQDGSARCPHGVRGAGRLARDPAVGLRARVGVHVERLGRSATGERVRPRDHGLRSQRLDRPRRRHLRRHDTVEVALEADVVDDEHVVTRTVQHERIAVAAARHARLGRSEQAQHRAAGEPHRGVQMGSHMTVRGLDHRQAIGAPRLEAVLARGVDRHPPPARIDRDRRHRHARVRRLLQADAHACAAAGRPAGARVVLAQDPAVGMARLAGVSHRAVLGEADAVAEAVAGDPVLGASRRDPGGEQRAREREHGDRGTMHGHGPHFSASARDRHPRRTARLLSTRP